MSDARNTKGPPTLGSNLDPVGVGAAAASYRHRFSAALDRIRTWRNRRRLGATLGLLEDYQLEDIGIRRGNVRDYARAGPDASRLLRRMLALRGIELDDALTGSRDWDALLASCRTCPATAACGRWIHDRDLPDGDREFCPNSAALAGLMRRQGGGHQPSPVWRSVPGFFAEDGPWR